MPQRQKPTILLAAVALSVALPAFAASGPNIARVEDRRPPVGDAIASSSFNALHLDKFADERLDVDGHVFLVHWDPADAGTPAGTVVQFEYRQQDPEKTRSLNVSYPFIVNTRRCATFKITGEAFRTGGLVTAWRVRILNGGQVLAEQQSKSWR